MAPFSWLHLTDLHVGLSEGDSLWPSAVAAFETDLAKAGAVDVVLFTGDLVQAGGRAEYDRLTERLEGILGLLGQRGREPVLLAVPGNHDLQRPKSSSAVRGLLNWSNDPELRKVFWEGGEEAAEYYAVVRDAFAEFVAWRARWYAAHPLPENVEARFDGMLPGDFALTFKHPELVVGWVGLNTAFLQLGASVKCGELALNQRQLNALCNGDPNRFVKRHNACFLMTHHPPEWLGVESLANYTSAIFLPTWFAAHLCGHLHDPRPAETRLGGGPVSRVLQGASLFGLEGWTAQSGKQTRIQGYSWSRLTRKNGSLELRSWPRLSQPRQGGSWRVIPDLLNYDLEEDHSWTTQLPYRAIQAHATPLPSEPQRKPEPPGRGYHEEWYVARDVEPTALQALRSRNFPVLLTGPSMCGKSTVFRRLIEMLRNEDRVNRDGIVVKLDLGLLSDEALESEDLCFREVGALIAAGARSGCTAIGLDPPELNDALAREWASAEPPRAPERRLRSFFASGVLSLGLSRIVLAMDRFDRVIGRRVGNPLARMLRAWVEDLDDRTFEPLRVLLTVTGLKLYFSQVDNVSELFASSLHLSLPNFRLKELRALADLYGRPWSDADLGRILELVDGQPYLSRLILFLEASGVDKEEVLDQERLEMDHCALLLMQMWGVVKERPDLHAALGAYFKLGAGDALAPEHYERLYRAGFVRKSGERYVFPNKLVEVYLRKRL